MNFILSIIAFALIFGLSITIHEAGHFYFAKRAGVLCHEFSFGMGKVLKQWKKGETTYSIRMIPIGGYVAMAGEDADSTLIKKDAVCKLLINDGIVEKIILRDKKNQYSNLDSYTILSADLYGKNGKDLTITVLDEEKEEHTFTCKRDGHYVDNDQELQFSPYDRCLESKPFLARFMTIFAGPFTNFILALIIFFIIGLINGRPMTESNVMGDIPEGYPANIAGINEGDKITHINGEKVDSFDEISAKLNSIEMANGVKVTFEHEGNVKEEVIMPLTFFYSIGFRADETSDKLAITGLEGTLAEEQGFMDQDIILSIDNVEMKTWQDVVNTMETNNSGRVMTFKVLRDGEEVLIYADPYSEEILHNQGVGITDSVIGINPAQTFSLPYALKYSYTGLFSSIANIFDTLRLLFVSDEVGVSNLSGPLGIFTMTSNFVRQGLVATLTWFGLLSANIGFINLLPVPALDGGRILFLIIEKISGKPVNRKVEATINNVFFMLLMLLMLYVTFNDVLRLF